MTDGQIGLASAAKCKKSGRQLRAVILRPCAVFFVLVLNLAFAELARGTQLLPEWIRQLGTNSADFALDVSGDGLGNVYIAGKTSGLLGGPSTGPVFSTDAFLGKYNSSGELQWVRQIGEEFGADGFGVSADKYGNVFFSGYIELTVSGSDGAAFLQKYNGDGDLIWERHYTETYTELAQDVVTDGMGNTYIVGETGPVEDVFLAKYDISGNFLWSQKIGVNKAIDRGYGIAVDAAGNPHITGYTVGSLAAPQEGDGDIFVAKFSTSGDLLWQRQLGTSEGDEGTGIAVSRTGNVYISGLTRGALVGPFVDRNDAFLLSLDSDGNFRWGTQFGTVELDSGRGVSVDSQNNIYLVGTTGGQLSNPTASGHRNDIFLAKYTEDGTNLWTLQLEASSSQGATGVSADSLGSVFISGTTTDLFGQDTFGRNDAFVLKIVDPEFIVPEPNSSLLLVLGIVSAGMMVQWRKYTGGTTC